MARKKVTSNDRARQVVAQEAARIIVEQGIEDFRVAKVKAAERLGMSDSGSLPRNAEIEAAVAEHLKLFGRESHIDWLRLTRKAALAVMEMLAPFRPRLVGPVLHGTAATNASINLHLFADQSELVALKLRQQKIPFKPYERRLKCRPNKAETFGGYRFTYDDSPVEATVFPLKGIRQAPISPIDGRPMQRVDVDALQDLLND